MSWTIRKVIDAEQDWPECMEVMRGDEMVRYVPERTCTNAEREMFIKDGYFKCSKCHFEFCTDDEYGGYWMKEKPKHCPECGRRIEVEE